MPRSNFQTVFLCLGIAAAVLAAYANHFQNDFHFDDFHTVTLNRSIGDWRNIPLFFVDPALFSSEAEGRTWRPPVSTSLALDYWSGHGLKPFYFHLSTFIWLTAQVVFLFFLFRRIMDSADPHPSNLWTAWLVAACYGLHPVSAETVNYIIQRGDLYDALGLVASLLWFVAYPRQRRYGWYLIPAVAAYFSKAPALIYPFILLAYVFLFEQEGAIGPRKKWAASIRTTLPAFAVTAVAAILTAKMTPETYEPGAESASLYRLTQPWVALHYFKCFFLPTGLSADPGWSYVSGAFSSQAVGGYVFVTAILAVAFLAARKRELRPVGFGIFWFILALLPTSLLPLGDVMNDHRMFFPMVGLDLAVFWALRMLLFRKTTRLTTGRIWVRGAVIGSVAVLTAAAMGTHLRNRVWHSEESLWRDVTEKNPRNPRGLMNYALTLIGERKYAGALPYLEQATIHRPGEAAPEVTLAIAYDGLGHDARAEQHFQRALNLAGDEDEEPQIHYARWLKKKGRLLDAQAQLQTALRKNELSTAARELLSEILCEQGKPGAAAALLQHAIQSALDADTAREFLAKRAMTPANATPEALLDLSTEYCRNAEYDACLLVAQRVLELRPGWAEDYNAISGAYLSMEHWEEGIRAARQALDARPDYHAARSNLEWGLTHVAREP